MGVAGARTTVTKPAVFLDRDGVINNAVVRDGKPYPPASPDAMEILPGVPQALERLKASGFALIVVTNQPDVARGRQRREVVEAMNAQLGATLPIDEFRVCYHDDADECACRKPRPGLLTQPPVYDLGASVMVGDRWRDIEAGRRAGVRATVLVDHGYDERCDMEPDVRVASLSEAADWIVKLPLARTT
jgi:D-glycero-D-manno-heptose 1,7-bisphosphate phosphatase